MTVSLIGCGLLCGFIALSLRGIKYGFWAAMAFLPMGALSVFTMGNFNLLALHAAFLILVGSGVISRFFIFRNPEIDKIETPVFILGLLTIYVVVMSQVLPRLFRGDVMVFSLQGGVDGYQISPLFLSQISELAPSSGNISQPVYFILSSCIFILTLSLARRQGAKLLDKAIYVSATVNAVLGFMNAIGLDKILTLLKTAEYSIFLDAKVAGVLRIVGAFPEASTMGSFSAAMFAYLIIRYFDTGHMWTMLLAIVNFLWAILALSSTGFAALGIAGAFVGLKIVLQTSFTSISRDRSLRILLLSLVALIFIILCGFFTNLFSAVQVFLDELIFNKATSLSGLERQAWTDRGYAIGLETYGLGAGLGSTRSNGLIAVLFSNIGLIGMGLYGWFLWSVFKHQRSKNRSKAGPSHYDAATAGLVTVLAGAVVSGTTADPGILLMVFAALVVASNPPRYIALAKRHEG